MPAVVRVKRRIDEEPLSAFVLNGKRRRLEEETGASGGAKEELSTLLKFAGTIKEQDDTATTQYARLSKEQAKELVLQKSHKPSNFNDKLRQEVRQQQQEQRFRVVNCLRTTLEGDVDEASASAAKKSKEITIVDIEKHNATTTTPNAADNKTVLKSTTNEHLLEASTSAAAAATSAAAAAAALTMPTDSDTGYVYDLYIPDNEQQADYVDLMDDNYLSVRAFDDLIYEDRYNNEDDEEYDSEDSNQENYFGNEYPDEDDDAALNSDREIEIDDIDEDESTKHLRKGLEKFVFGDDDDEENDVEGFNDSSSDDGGFYNAYRDPYVHSIDPEEEGFCNDVDSCDVDRYGLAYARYKARILKKTKAKKGDEDDEDEEDEEAEFYKTGTDEEDDYYHSANESDEDEYY